MKIVELSFALAVLALSGIGLAEATAFPRASAYLPVAVLGLACVLSLAWAMQSAIAIRRERPTLAINPAEARRFVTLALLSPVYALAMGTIGFFTSTILFLPIAALALGYRNWRAIALATVAFVGLLYAVFGLLLKTPLPAERLLQLGAGA